MSISIEEFLELNQDKKIVVVQGLGFVGFVMSLVVANSPKDEYAVIGIDINQDLVNDINNGKLTIQSSDPKVQEYFEIVKRKRNLFCSSDSSVYGFGDVIIVDINLDVKKATNFSTSGSFDVDLTNFKQGIESIGYNCKEDVTIIVETTVPPGTCLKVIYPILEKSYKIRGIDVSKMSLGHSYERVMPGPNYIDSIINYPRVYSGINKLSETKVKDFLESILNTRKYPLKRLKNTTATETAKVLENSYRAMNIAFIEEWSNLAENADIDLFEIIDAIKDRPTHQNIMKPGFGVGGYCLTKDPLLASWASKNFFNHIELNQSVRAVMINDNMPRHVLNLIKTKSRYKPILGVLGVSYLKDVGDTRNTPFEIIYSDLKEFSKEIKYCDPYIEEFLQMKSYDISSFAKEEMDTLLIGAPHSIYIDERVIEKLIAKNPNLLIIDPFNITKEFEHFNKHIIGNGIIK